MTYDANRVLFTGASGLLGRYMFETKPINVPLFGTYNKHPFGFYNTVPWSIPDREPLEDLISWFSPTVIVHAAGPGSVDWCQMPENSDAAYEQIVTGAQVIADICKDRYIRPVYISTNAVYSGEYPPYDEEAPHAPVNRYGELKALAEKCFGDTALIVRPILMYGWPWTAEARQNWASKIVQTLTWGGDLWLVTDRYTQPTYAADVARALWYLIDQRAKGSYNIGGASRCTLYEFGIEVARVFELDTALIRKSRSDSFGIAPRPVDTTYSREKILKTLPADLIPCGIETGLLKMRVEGGLEYD